MTMPVPRLSPASKLAPIEAGLAAIIDRLSTPVLGAVVLSFICAVMFTIGSDGVPVIDRDEARFAQASKQMLETGNFLEIFFQDEPRNKKPPLTYWLQAASAAVFGGEELNRISAYRLPSMLGGWLAVISLFLLGPALVGRSAAFLAALSLTFCLGLAVEVNQAKTDALLLVAITTTLLCFAPAAMGASLKGWRTWLGWIALALGIMIKGPIAPLVVALCWVSFSILASDWRWLRRTKPWLGLLCAIVIASPWYVAVSLASDSNFIGQALSEDLFSKVFSGQESHGALPGYYLIFAVLTFLPLSLFAVPAPGSRLSIARSATAALSAVLAGSGVVAVLNWCPQSSPITFIQLCPRWRCWLLSICFPDRAEHSNHALRRLSFVNAAVVSAVFVVGLIGLIGAGVHYQPSLIPSLIIAGVGVGVIALCLFALLRVSAPVFAPITYTAAVASASAVALFTLGEGLAPRMDSFWVSRSVNHIIQGLPAEPKRLGTTHHEPSMVFTLGTDIMLLDPSQLAEALADGRIDLAIVERGNFPEFQTALGSVPTAQLQRTVSGFNYTKGRSVELIFITKLD